jgi:hypothetical protein
VKSKTTIRIGNPLWKVRFLKDRTLIPFLMALLRGLLGERTNGYI